MANFKEVDYVKEVRAVARPAGCGGGVQQYVVKETFEEVDQVSRACGRGSSHFEKRVTKVEEDFNTRTGEFHERKENFLARSDN